MLRIMSKSEKLRLSNKPEQLDVFLKRIVNCPNMPIFRPLQPPQDYFVVPTNLITRKFYGALDKLNEISQIYSFCPESKIVRRYDGHLSDNYAIVVKITKPILDNLLALEDLTQELKLLASLSSQGEFTEVPARSLGYESINSKLEKVLYTYSDFEKMYKLRYRNRGFKIYQVRINSITRDALSQLHTLYLFYPSSMPDYGFLCYPIGDSKKISSLDNLNQEEKTEVLASLLGIQLETNGQWAEEGAQHAQDAQIEEDDEVIEEGAQEGA